jgi:hypothetical protein
MEKLVEHTNGNHIYMKMKLDNERIEEIDVYLKEDGKHYKTSVDYNQTLKEEVIRVFNELY